MKSFRIWVTCKSIFDSGNYLFGIGYHEEQWKASLKSEYLFDNEKSWHSQNKISILTIVALEGQLVFDKQLKTTVRKCLGLKPQPIEIVKYMNSHVCIEGQKFTISREWLHWHLYCYFVEIPHVKLDAEMSICHTRVLNCLHPSSTYHSHLWRW